MLSIFETEKPLDKTETIASVAFKVPTTNAAEPAPFGSGFFATPSKVAPVVQTVMEDKKEPEKEGTSICLTAAS